MRQTNKDTRHKELLRFLTGTMHASCVQQYKGPNGSRIETWICGKGILIITLWPDDGWDYYLQGDQMQPNKAMEQIKQWYTVPIENKS